MNRRGFMRAILSVGAAPYVVATIGAPNSPSAPTIELDINANSWSAGWPETKRVNMEYSNAHQHTNGRQLEFAFAQHSRKAGDHTSVRWSDFSANGPPKQGYYWPESDINIAETDNLATAYLPWLDWAWLCGLKIIDLKNAKPIFRNKDGAGVDFWSAFHELQLGGNIGRGQYSSNYNPACLVNPDGEETYYFGGGYWTNNRSGNYPAFKILKKNPSYPATSPKPLILRAFQYNTHEAPCVARHAVKHGDWIYWGGAMQDPGMGDPNAGKLVKDRSNRFYRIFIRDLARGIVTQERITDCPLDTTYSPRFSLLAIDASRSKLIYINAQGVFRYTIPANNGNNGTWEGPYTFGIANWAMTMSQGVANGLTGDWHGVIGTHRSDLNQTFFRYNLSRRWNRVRWSA